ncbi:hypothetical protein GCM10007301_14800 [Azorhizobium oxalatiphilum]|uniref:Uncharacterized protein n=1 Tax=Azorhizobium oxalatiphilum TaxID=980631 RepID=A0A917BVI9_9HYPH|nr:hypothetical protein GCM10007301_14800 [Azorhizobium oxalatiphilum]
MSQAFQSLDFGLHNPSLASLCGEATEDDVRSQGWGAKGGEQEARAENREVRMIARDRGRRDAQVELPSALQKAAARVCARQRSQSSTRLSGSCLKSHARDVVRQMASKARSRDTALGAS